MIKNYFVIFLLFLISLNSYADEQLFFDTNVENLLNLEINKNIDNNKNFIENLSKTEQKSDKSEENLLESENLSKTEQKSDKSEENLLESENLSKVEQKSDKSEENLLESEDLLKTEQKSDKSEENLLESEDLSKTEQKSDKSEENLLESEDLSKTEQKSDKSEEDLLESEDLSKTEQKSDKSEENLLESEDLLKTEQKSDKSEENLLESEDLSKTEQKSDKSEENLLESEDLLELDDNEIVEENPFLNKIEIPEKINAVLGYDIDFNNYIFIKDSSINIKDIKVESDFDKLNAGIYEIKYIFNNFEKIMLVNLTKNERYLSDYIGKIQDNIIYNVGWDEMRVDSDFSNRKLAMKQNDIIKSLKKGILIHAPSKMTINLKDLNINSFEGYLAVNQNGVKIKTPVIANIYVDNEIIKSYNIDFNNPSPYIFVDLNGKDNFSIEFKVKGSNAEAHSGIFDAKININDVEEDVIFDTSDLEIYKHQFIDSTILENCNAKIGDFELNDILEYECDYSGEVGVYDLKYFLDFNGKRFEKTIKLYVSEDEILRNMSEEELKKPFKNSLYWGRSILTSEARKVWDFTLYHLLNYNTEKSTRDEILPVIDNEYYTLNGRRDRMKFKLYDNGIRVRFNEISWLRAALIRNDSRMYLIHDGGERILLKKGGFGYVDTIEIGIHNEFLTKDAFINNLKAIENNVLPYFNEIKDDMTYSQMNKILLKNIHNKTIYSFNGPNSDLRGVFLNKNAICGGYAKGLMYLLHRSGIPSIWAEGYPWRPLNGSTYHAWNYIKLEDGNWYMDDPTFGMWHIAKGMLNLYKYEDVQNDPKYKDIDKRFQNNTFFKMPPYVQKNFDRDLMNYPNIDIVINPVITIEKSTYFNPYDYIINIFDNKRTSRQDLISKIKFEKLEYVNTDVVGFYKIYILLENDFGDKVKKEVLIKVVDNLENYLKGLDKIELVNLNPLSYKVGWGNIKFYKNLKEDNSISILDKDLKEMGNYSNTGIYMHANSNISYDIPENAKFFECFAGINKDVRNSRIADAKAKVFLDGKLEYESKILRPREPGDHIILPIDNKFKKINIVFDALAGNGEDHTVLIDPVFYIDENKSFPIIEANDVEILEGDSFSIDLLKIKVTDEKDGNLSFNAFGDVNNNKSGDYYITIRAMNSSLNVSEKICKVTVLENKSNVVEGDLDATINGSNKPSEDSKDDVTEDKEDSENQDKDNVTEDKGDSENQDKDNVTEDKGDSENQDKDNVTEDKGDSENQDKDNVTEDKGDSENQDKDNVTEDKGDSENQDKDNVTEDKGDSENQDKDNVTEDKGDSENQDKDNVTEDKGDSENQDKDNVTEDKENKKYGVFDYTDDSIYNLKEIEEINKFKIPKKIYDYVEENSKNDIINFNDVNDHWASESINFVSKNHFMIGDENGNFNPNDKISVAEFLTIIKRIDELNINKNNFKQVNSQILDDFKDFWYYDTFKWALENGFITKKEDVLFANNTLNRENMCLIIDKFIKNNDIKLVNIRNLKFDDENNINYENRKVIKKLLNSGIINGRNYDFSIKFDPKSGTNRAEVSKIIENLLK